MNILSMTDYVRRRIFESGKTPEQIAQERVRSELRRKVPDTILRQAQARAVRLIATSKYSVDLAVEQVCKWALNAEHPTPPFAA